MALCVQLRPTAGASVRAGPARVSKARVGLAPVAYCRPTPFVTRCSGGARSRCGPGWSGMSGAFYGPGFGNATSVNPASIPVWNKSPGGRRWKKLFTELTREFADAVEQASKEVENNTPPAAQPAAENDGTLRLQVDVTEDESAYYITADVPGTAKEDIRLQISAPDPTSGMSTLTISGERRRDVPSSADAPSVGVRRTERPSGRFSRALQLPKDAMREGVSAQTLSGVLTITILRQPKIEPEVPPPMDIPVF